mmetsp:Transcript_1020/g.1787  ORF Transcript_1020/g.1787 Transcript_1020/m.1787 type:complete len:810 (-) Transcript_1020:175-2604(-)
MSVAFAWLPVLAILASLSAYSPPSDYDLDDEFSDHNAVGKAYAKAGDMDSAILSFRAACRHNDSPDAYANLGVALMRNGELAAGYKALMEAQERNPAREGTKKNIKALLDHAQKKGISKKDLETESIYVDLQIEAAGAAAGEDAGEETEFTWRPNEGASDYGDGNEGILLLDADSVAERAETFLARGEKRLARGLASLALHLNPFLKRDEPHKVKILQGEKLDYWRGNIYLGYDKTGLEAIMSKDEMSDSQIQEVGIVSWRNMQLTRLSCCGIDNMAVWLSRNSGKGHPYIVPFLELIPGYLRQLKPENMQMYQSFKQWWSSLPNPRMPEPRIIHRGNGIMEWELMKVALQPSRVPPGWDEMIQAVLLRNFKDWEGMRGSAHMALQKNEELSVIVDELLPELSSMATPYASAVPSPVVAEEKKYVLSYNPCVGLGNIAVAMVSAHMLAKLTGRTLLVHWNQNSVTRHAYQLKERSDVALVARGASEAGITFEKMKSIYFFHTTDDPQMTEALEIFACSNMKESLKEFKAVTISSNLFFAPLLATNPHTPPGDVPEFPDLLADLLAPSAKAVKRALSYAEKVEWGKEVPVVGIHIRAREKGEDNDDWPTRDTPEAHLLEKLWRCAQQAVQLELGDTPQWDVYVASTTEAARTAVEKALKKNIPGVRNVLGLPKIDRNRKTGSGNTDAMAESLLFSRVDVFVRMVVGTNGFSTFAFLSNALRTQGQWAVSMPALRPGTERFAPNYVVTDSCGEGRCFSASPKVRMASIAWHGQQVMTRSCGDVMERMKEYSAGVGEEGCSHFLKTISLDDD